MTLPPLTKHRSLLVTCALVAIYQGAVGFLPLFGGPGYEHSVATGAFVPSAASVLCALYTSRERNLAPLSALAIAARFSAVLGVLSLSIAFLHGARVGICEWRGATIDFALGPGIGCIVGGLWGAASGIAAPRRRLRRTAAVLLALLGPLGSIGISVARFYSSPIIFAFDPFFGYFSGALYDTVIETGSSLLTYRSGSLLTIAAAIAFASLLSRNDGALSFHTESMSPTRGVRILSFALFATGSLLVTFFGDKLGHWHTRSSIEAALGGKMAGARCDIVYPQSMRLDEAKMLAKDCDEEVASIERKLGTTHPDRITAFFFRDSAEKRRLMGAADVYIAKPWRHEVYLQIASYPHPVLGHEIAHVVAGTLAKGPFYVAGKWGGALANPGLIEGTAVYAAPDDEELTDGQWSRLMLDLGILPPIERLFSMAFLAQNSSKSYTVAGSFVTFVVERYSLSTLQKWYGGAELDALVGRSWSALDAEYREYLLHVPLSDAAKSYAKAKFDRPSVFGRKCPHLVDALRREADACRDGQRFDRARQLYDSVLTQDPHDFAALHGRAAVDLKSGASAAGRSAFESMAAKEDVPRTWRDKADESLADDDLASGRADVALRRYAAMIARGVDEDQLRTLEVKAFAAREEAARAPLVALLIGVDGRAPDAWHGASEVGLWRGKTGDPLASYLVGRNLAQRALYTQAVGPLDRALEGSLPTARLVREALKQRAICACALRDREALIRVTSELKRPDGPFSVSLGRLESVIELVERCIPYVVPPAP